MSRHDLFALLEWFGMNQIYVNKEDYEFVKRVSLTISQRTVRTIPVLSAY